MHSKAQSKAEQSKGERMSTWGLEASMKDLFKTAAVMVQTTNSATHLPTCRTWPTISVFSYPSPSPDHPFPLSANHLCMGAVPVLPVAILCVHGPYHSLYLTWAYLSLYSVWALGSTCRCTPCGPWASPRQSMPGVPTDRQLLSHG
jgi:hypothetical protein